MRSGWKPSDNSTINGLSTEDSPRLIFYLSLPDWSLISSPPNSSVESRFLLMQWDGPRLREKSTRGAWSLIFLDWSLISADRRLNGRPMRIQKTLSPPSLSTPSAMMKTVGYGRLSIDNGPLSDSWDETSVESRDFNSDAWLWPSDRPIERDTIVSYPYSSHCTVMIYELAE